MRAILRVTLSAVILTLVGACGSEVDRLERLRAEERALADRAYELQARLSEMERRDERDRLAGRHEEIMARIRRPGVTVSELDRLDSIRAIVADSILRLTEVGTAELSDPEWIEEYENLLIRIIATEDSLAIVRRDIQRILR